MCINRNYISPVYGDTLMRHWYITYTLVQNKPTKT